MPVPKDSAVNLRAKRATIGAKVGSMKIELTDCRPR